jgi:hypothetical protein
MANIRKHPIGMRFISYRDKWYTIMAKTPDFYIVVRDTDDLPSIEIPVTSTGIDRKNLKDPYVRTIYDFGYIGVGEHFTHFPGGNKTEAYLSWKGMINRVCGKNQKSCYNSVSICDEWSCFQNFADWFNTSNFKKGWCLDKDLLSVSNKIYSPSTCCFLPYELNSFISVNYKKPGSLSGDKYRARVKDTINQKVWTFVDKDLLNVQKCAMEKKVEIAKCLANKWRDDIPTSAYDVLANFHRKYEDG